ncbi:hypothetical protein [Haloarchaeobius sp. TZWSO28]|uniref:hypothetical protein n=1 Tax=Haloarchaeobius sp. TZWSO28 TaxID=3446119 RepID=UPI003EC1093D
MQRRTILQSVGASLASIPLVASAGAANEGGKQPVGGTLPNENAPVQQVSAFPSGERTVEAGQFLRLENGWVFFDLSDAKIREFFEKTRQTFTFDGQRFVLDSYEEWKEHAVEGTEDLFLFTHTDTPKGVGERFEVTWDVVYTDAYYDPIREIQYEQGERSVIFPFQSRYEVVAKDSGAPGAETGRR